MVNVDSLFSSTSLYLRDFLKNNITDPISGTRISNEKFVMTSYPDRPVRYPILTVRKNSPKLDLLGENSNDMEVTLPFEIRAWCRNEIERDTLSWSIANKLRKNQQPFTTSGTSLSEDLYGFSVDSIVPVDEPGKAGIKSDVISISYKYIAV